MTGKSLLIIGEIVGVHGLAGKLKVRSYAESVDTFKPGVRLNIKSSEVDDGVWHEVLASSAHKKGVLLTLKGVGDIDSALSLKGKEILIKREDIPCGHGESEENTYFWQDLIGLEVFDIKQGILGRIVNVFKTGANDVFVVESREDNGNKETLVPAIESVIKDVNIEEGIIKIDLPQGL